MGKRYVCGYDDEYTAFAVLCTEVLLPMAKVIEALMLFVDTSKAVANADMVAATEIYLAAEWRAKHNSG